MPVGSAETKRAEADERERGGADDERDRGAEAGEAGRREHRALAHGRDRRDAGRADSAGQRLATSVTTRPDDERDDHGAGREDEPGQAGA